jgi:hypothetical protein
MRWQGLPGLWTLRFCGGLGELGSFGDFLTNSPKPFQPLGNFAHLINGGSYRTTEKVEVDQTAWQ